ncbi:MAG: hypothetical protein ACRCTA_05705, partial [Bacilli bacterium]
ENGYFVATKQELAFKIEELAQLNKEAYQVLKGQAYLKAQDYSSSQFGDHVLDVYEKALLRYCENN